MSRPLRKVLVVNTADEGGGTERFAGLLVKSLRQRQIDAWMVVGQKLSNDPRAVSIHASGYMDYGRYNNPWHRRIVPALRTIEDSIGLEKYRYPFSYRLADITGSPPDIILGCNLHGGYFDIRALATISRRIPVAIRPGDAWLATGHCAVPATCERWRSGCGHCPDLERSPSIQRDLTRLNWRRKRRVYRSARWSLISPSAWQANRLDQSMLRHALGSRHVIRNGVDQSCFRAGSRDAARQTLGLAPDRVIGLLVANLGQNSPSKDFQTLRGALMRLSQQPIQTAFDIVAIGAERSSETFGAITISYLAHIKSPARLASYYQAADFLINPTYEETFSNVTAEAMSCGLPVLASRVAAIPEIVSDGETGLLVAPADGEALAAALDLLATDGEVRQRLSAAAAAYARQEFSIEKMTDRYIEVFDQTINEHAEAARTPAKLLKI
jgi:glycosyltransferase involved in cell wall biosynthesis